MRTISKSELVKAKGKKVDKTQQMADQAIASMRDSVNGNQAIMGEIVKQLSVKPKEFLIQRDAKGDMVKIIPVY